MSEDNNELKNNLSEYIPTEVLMYIFSFLNPKHLTYCREVCTRWKEIVDSLLSQEHLWRKHCEKDFAAIYKTAYYKRRPDLSWRNLYRSLSLWSKFQYAAEIREEIAPNPLLDDIRGFQILSQAEIGVHTSRGIIYFNLKTLKPAHKYYTIPGSYEHYFENEEYVIIKGLGSHLYVICKNINSLCKEPSIILRSVKTYILNDGVLYYLTVSNEVYMCDLKSEEIKFTLLTRIACSGMCLGYRNGDLHVLTYSGKIFTIVGKESIFQCTIYNTPNLMFHRLHVYNFIEKLDWRMYQQWIFKLRTKVLQRLVKDLTAVVRVYGDFVFVGSCCGVFKIYHSPYIDNKLDIWRTKPVKEYNLNDHRNGGVVPILHIDVIEGVDCHTVLVGTPYKIAIINYYHKFVNNVPDLNFCEPQSVAIQ